jgi:hypothetical protein
MSARKQQPHQYQHHHDQKEHLVRAWEGPMEQAAASLLGARQKVGMRGRSIDRVEKIDR